MFDKTFDNGARVVLPEDPEKNGCGVLFTYYPSGDAPVTGLMCGEGNTLVGLLLMNMKKLAGSMNPKQRAIFVREAGEVLVDIAQGAEGIEAMMIKKGVEEDDADEDD